MCSYFYGRTRSFHAATPIEFCLRRAAPCRSIVTTPAILAKAFKPPYKLHSKLSQLCRRLAELINKISKGGFTFQTPSFTYKLSVNAFGGNRERKREREW